MEESDSQSDCEEEILDEFDEEGPTFYESEEEDIECQVWDDDCKVVGHSFRGLLGFHLMPTCSREPELRPKKRQKISPQMRDSLLSSETTAMLKKYWTNNSELSTDNTHLIVEPFKICVIKNFLGNESLLNETREEFNELDFNARNMDLYEFFQSKDINYLKNEHMNCVYEFLKRDVMKWVSDVTGYHLTHVSATCSVYTNTDYLLVHDDQREDRMVAFILYLTGKDGWNKNKGGSLQLFSKDKTGHPFKVVNEIFPEHNQFIFFPVSNESYHQVAEVTSLGDCRLSINGWFHTKSPPMFNTPEFIPSENSIYGKSCLKPRDVDIDLKFWLNKDYLQPKTIKMIQQHIEENSEISLKNFLTSKSFNCLLHDLANENIVWQKVHPPNRYLYEVADYNNLPDSVEKFINLFQSKQMFDLLEKYTDLELNNDKSSMKFELQKWTPGCYSLLNDYDWKEKNELDLIIYFGCGNGSDVIGARTQYVTMEDEIQNALITLEAEDNSLNIVYRDSARLTKYFSKQSKCLCFYSLICSYSE